MPLGWKSSGPSPRLTFGPIALDRTRHTASVTGRGLDLSAAEFVALGTLLESRHEPLPREAIAASLAENGLPTDPRMSDVLIFRLRRKLAEAGLGGLIATAWGRGYVATDPDRDAFTPETPHDGHHEFACRS